MTTESDPMLAEGVPAVGIYSGGELETAGAAHCARLAMALTVVVVAVGPAVLAYIAGTKDGPDALFSGDGTTFLILALVAAAFLLWCLSCCCAWNSRLKCGMNLVGKGVPLMTGPMLTDDQHNPKHIAELRVKVDAQNKQGAAAVDVPKLLAQYSFKCENTTITSSSGGPPIHVRIYRPQETPTDPVPVLIYLHGGGWVFGGTAGGTLDSQHDALSIRLAARCNGGKCIAVYPDYRKAPLHKFPAAPDDCLDVLKHVVGAGQADLNADVTRVAVAGDSAGGNLAAVLAQDALAAGIPLKHQLLIYPVTSARVHWFKSWRENQNQPILTARFMLWFWREYLENYEDSTNPRAAPLEAASLRGICPATLITAEFDPLRDEGIAYGKKLEADGVTVAARHFSGTVHAFFGAGMGIPKGKEGFEFGAGELAKALA